MATNLILASTSPYRRTLLQQLGVDFSQTDPCVEESVVSQESPPERAIRLARDKAVGASNLSGSPVHATTTLKNACIFIGSDQVAHLGHTIFSKPGEFEAAYQQLLQCSGHWVTFSTAVCLVDELGQVLAEGIDIYKIKYRNLSDLDIRKYLEIDRPFDCAGSIKAEKHGITLIERAHGNDINTLYGLPLILLIDLLDEAGFHTISHIKLE